MLNLEGVPAPSVIVRARCVECVKVGLRQIIYMYCAELRQVFENCNSLWRPCRCSNLMGGDLDEGKSRSDRKRVAATNSSAGKWEWSLYGWHRVSNYLHSRLFAIGKFV